MRARDKCIAEAVLIVVFHMKTLILRAKQLVVIILSKKDAGQLLFLEKIKPIVIQTAAQEVLQITVLSTDIAATATKILVPGARTL